MVETATSRRPRVLFVAGDVPWPPDGGGRIATLRNLQAFAGFCDVDLIALADPIGELDLAELQAICRSVTIIRHPFTFGLHRRRQSAVAAASLLSAWPYRLRKFRSRAFAHALSRLRTGSTYDLEHFDQFGVAPYQRPGIPSTYACQNVESDVYRLAATWSRSVPARLWARQEGLKLRWAEQRLLARFDMIFVLAPEDGALLRRRGIARTRAIAMPAPPFTRTDDGPSPQPLIISLGTMSWFGVEDGLLWFRREVYPRIRAAVPQVRWRLVGPGASSRVRQLGGVDGIEVVGYVRDLKPLLDEARVAVIPLHVGGGIRMKLLDLMAAGVPTVSTSLGARGLAFADGQGCLRREDPVAFGDAVIALLEDDERWRTTVLEGRTYLATHHTAALLEAGIRAGVDDAIRHHRPDRVAT